MDVILDRGGRSSFKVCREYDLNCGDVTALSFSGDGNEVMACGLSGKAVVFGAKIGGMVRFDQATNMLCTRIPSNGPALPIRGKTPLGREMAPFTMYHFFIFFDSMHTIARDSDSFSACVYNGW